MITRDQVLAALYRHVGAAHGVRVDALVREITGAPVSSPAAERQVRSQVSELREEGYPIAAHPAHGYFVCETAEELQMCCAFLRSRAMHSLRLEAQMRRISLGELLGQIRLPT
jgi:hypothetical protein